MGCAAHPGKHAEKTLELSRHHRDSTVVFGGVDLVLREAADMGREAHCMRALGVHEQKAEKLKCMRMNQVK
jgi:hypothetical protein